MYVRTYHRIGADQRVEEGVEPFVRRLLGPEDPPQPLGLLPPVVGWIGGWG